ncbi:MAG TPA: hypothetical protein PKV80_29490, partial [Leptospiraceae bacterium]|nr:hypothetical protein [Leptospiraceae bacterium]
MKLNQKSGLLVMAVLTASCSPSSEKKQEADSFGQSNVPMERSSAGKKRAALQNKSVTPIYLENSADQRIQTVLYAQGALESSSENQHADLAAALLIRMIRPLSLFNQNPIRVLALEISPQEVVKSLSEFFGPSTTQGISALDISTALQDFASKVQTREESEAEKNLRIKFASWSSEIVRKAHTRAAEGDAQIQATLRGYFPSIPVQAKNEELLRKLKPTALTQTLIKMEGTSVKDLKKAQEIAKAAWDDIQNAKKNIRVILGKDESRRLSDEGKKNRL